MSRLVLTSLLLWPAISFSQDVSAPITYKTTMLVLVNDDGAAAVRFRATTDGAAAYDFRHEDKKGNVTTENNKPLIEVRDATGRMGGELSIKAGSMTVKWSKGGDDVGWVYYKPEEISVFIANAEYFSDRPPIAPGGEIPSIPKLDLKRFMRK
jgi:hypothetical protein